jgi:cytochrome b
MVIAIRPATPDPGDTIVAVAPRQAAPAGSVRTATPPPAPAAERLWRRVFHPADLGLAPVVLALSAFGVLLVALAYDGGRDSRGGSMAVYWIGQVVVFSPVVARLLARRLAGMAEALLLVIGLAVNQYVMKWAYSPDMFRFPDEGQHWTATTLITESGDLYRYNAALPPAVHFPGLAEMGAAVSGLTGLSVTVAGMLVAGIAHLVFVVALFAVVQRAGASPAVAGLTCVVYATAMHYLFFNSMFLYQTAALPFLILTVWAYRRWRAGDGVGWAMFGLVTTLVTTVSHHVTAFMLIGTLALLALTEIVFARPRRWNALLGPAGALLVVAAWIGLVARDVIGYLSAPVDRIAETVSNLMADKDTGAAPVALVQPWQLGVQALGLLALLVLFCLVAVKVWRSRDRSPWLWAALAGSAVFFAGNGVRFLGASGPEIAGRLSTFTYVPISIVAALALVKLNEIRLGRKRPERVAGWGTRIVVGTAVATLLLIGARAGGWPPVYAILPGPYLAAGFERSVDANGMAAAQWLAKNPGNRIAGDITGIALASTYGRQDPVREGAQLFIGPQWSLDDEDLIRAQYVQLLWVDRRLAQQTPASGAYFEHDPNAGRYTAPLPTAALRKFDGLPNADRIYDNGEIRLYRMGY